MSEAASAAAPAPVAAAKTYCEQQRECQAKGFHGAEDTGNAPLPALESECWAKIEIFGQGVFMEHLTPKETV